MGRRVRRGNAKRSPRGETQQQARERKRLEARADRRTCVDYVRERDRHHCRLCGRPVQYECDALDFGCVHEFVFRSLGGSDVEPTNCVLVCAACHTRVEPCIHPGPFHSAKRVIVPLDEDALMEGPICYHDVPIDGSEPTSEREDDIAA